MKNTTPDSGLPRMPNKVLVHSSNGETYTETAAEGKQRLAENMANTKALIRRVDKYWHWLVATEPNKLTNKLAVDDLLSVIVGHLLDEKKVAGADIISTVKRCVEEHRK